MTEYQEDTATYVPLSEQYTQWCAKIRTAVKECRQATNTTQDDLAIEMGATRKEIIYFETGQKTDIDLLIRLCEHYDIRIGFTIQNDSKG